MGSVVVHDKKRCGVLVAMTTITATVAIAVTIAVAAAMSVALLSMATGDHGFDLLLKSRDCQ